jgi:magnesium chelatase family protein
VLAKTESIAIIGTEARLVDVEVDVGVGLPTFRVVGLVAKSVTEAEQRIRSALQSSDCRWPPHRIVANLAPGGLRKEGTHFDLALALCVLSADGKLENASLDGWLVIGELGLDGSVRSVRGTLAAAIACREADRRGIICPAGNAAEAAVIDGIEVAPVRNLRECIAFLRSRIELEPVEAQPQTRGQPPADLSEVRGQEEAKVALEIAAAGGHNLLMHGPPGAGKTMLARRLPGILPPMSLEESLEVTRVHSVAGRLPEGGGLITQRPFRTPHHHISMAGLLGGGVGLARPGEVSLAHARLCLCYQTG